MHYVYVLKSRKDKGIYLGCTANLDNRISAHNKGKCASTKTRRPLHLVYYEAYASESDARVREGRLKKFKNSYTQLSKRIGKSIHT